MPSVPHTTPFRRPDFPEFPARPPAPKRHLDLLAPLPLCLLLFLSAGCAGNHYATSRVNDALDIVTVTVGNGFGAKGRVGPLQLGFLRQRDLMGLRGSRFLVFQGNPGEIQMFLNGYNLNGIEFYPFSLELAERHKDLEARSFCIFAAAQSRTRPDIVPYHYYTQAEVVVGFIPSVRLGFNPGELADFLLGWTTLDIFKDDTINVTPPWQQPTQPQEKQPPAEDLNATSKREN